MEIPRIDGYSVWARTAPMMVAIAPAVVVLATWVPALPVPSSLAWSLLAVVGFVLGQVARLVGKGREQELWSLWGGPPTRRMLRHRDQTRPQLRVRCHEILKRLGATVPGRDMEEADPEAADRQYDECVRLLIGLTRDTKRFPLVLKENINYGFWRNLWALKPAGLSLSAAGLLAIVLRSFSLVVEGGPLTRALVLLGALNAGLVLFWLVVVTTEAVRVPADAYAERLFEACVQLDSETTGTAATNSRIVVP